MQQLNTETVRRVVVIGGGISGLAAAHRLSELSARAGSKLELLLLEASARLGGTIATERRDQFLLERGPDAFISEKPEALNLVKSVGLESHLIETNELHRRSFVVRGGRLHPTPEGFQLLAPSRFWPLVTSKIFSWPGKARMALDLLLPRGASALNGTEVDESLAAFVRRRLGREALERMAQPMAGGIYTADPELLSLRATMPRFLEMERAHRSLIWAMWRAARRQQKEARRHGMNAGAGKTNAGGIATHSDAGAAHRASATSGARYNLFLSFDGGMQMLTDRLAELLPPHAVRLNSPVESVSFDAARRLWKIQLGGDAARATLDADALCLALPAYRAAQLLRGVDGVLTDELDAIPYASTATVNLAFRRADIPHPLDGFGFVSPFIERRAALACSFSSIKFAGRAPAGHALLRAFLGGALQPDMFALDEEAMIAAVRRDLRDLLGIERAPLFSVVHKWTRSMPQYQIGHLDRIGRIRARLRTLHHLELAGNSYHGAGIPDCVRAGQTAADLLSKD